MVVLTSGFSRCYFVLHYQGQREWFHLAYFENLRKPSKLPKLDNSSVPGKFSLGVVTHRQDNNHLNI